MALLTHSAWAQSVIAPLPSGDSDSSMQRITPPDQDTKASGMLTTHAVPNAPEKSMATPQPVLVAPKTQTLTPPPFARSGADVKATLVPPSSAPATAPAAFMPKSPFKHADPLPPAIPSGPHETVATPVGNVDAVEVSEPAPPTPVAAGADPVAEDPAAATEFNSPMFDNATDSGAARKIVIRVLNKVTAQSALYKARPGETILFGRLQIIAEMCRVSAPNSQTDYAGLLDIKEKLPGKEGIKPLFRGWMYASSPSVAGLEHPIYDVTMITCEMADAAPKDDPKPVKKASNSKKK